MNFRNIYLKRDTNYLMSLLIGSPITDSGLILSDWTSGTDLLFCLSVI